MTFVVLPVMYIICLNRMTTRRDHVSEAVEGAGGGGGERGAVGQGTDLYYRVSHVST